MADSEKVIKGLETCKSVDMTCSDCPYNGEICTTSLCDDVLDLMNDQQRQIEELQERLAIVLEGQPEIVRCKDCRWWHESEIHKGFGDCGQANGIALKSSDWFCADGERKDS
jgi:hypothetical protein